MKANRHVKLLGLDIGGANIKLSDGHGYHHHHPFALWQAPDQLAPVLRMLGKQAPSHEALAITMTGELTDCFVNKQEGVAFIVDAVAQATDQRIGVYLVDGRFVDPAEAKQAYALAAASNWHALTSFVAQALAGGQAGLLIDSGSTTTDVIPFRQGQVVARGMDDYGRLIHGELVYTGSVRSSLAGIISHVHHRGQTCPVMNELFATALDAHIILGNLPANENEYYAADGAGTAPAACLARMARLIGKDSLTFDASDAREMAQQVFEAQRTAISDAIQQVQSSHQLENPQLIVSGQGEFLAEAASRNLECTAAQPRILRWSGQFDPAASNCATAFSIARLAESWWGGADIEPLTGNSIPNTAE